MFPEGTNGVLVKWFNNAYGDFTVEETKVVWECISKHPEIERIANQIWRELKELVDTEEEWRIS